MLNTIIHGDCLEVMQDIPDQSVDMVLCDLPYGKTDCKWDSQIPLTPLWEQYNRIITDVGAIVLFGAQPFTSALVMSNIDMFKYCWVWHKSLAPDFMNARNKPMRNHEDIVVFSQAGTATRSNPKMNYFPQGLIYSPRTKNGARKDDTFIGGGRPSRKAEYVQLYTNYPKTVIQFSSEGKKIHPTQKPLALCEYLIQTYTLPGETVLDNTCGSGTTCLAAKNTGRNYIGIEKDENYYHIALGRVSDF